MHFSEQKLVLVFIFLIPIIFQIWVSIKERTIAEIQTCSAYALITQIVIFLYAQQSWNQTQRILVLLLSMGYLFWAMGTATNRARKVAIDPLTRLKISTRNLIGVCLLYGIYFGVSKSMLAMNTTVSTYAALPCALIALIYSTPLILRVMWKTSTITDPNKIKIIQDSFGVAGINVKRMYFIELDKIKFHNALVCGPKLGFGPFQRSIFITKSLFENMTSEEVKAVLLHEAAHFKLNHLPKRMGAIILAFIFTVFWALLALAFFPTSIFVTANAIVSALFTFFTQVTIVFLIARRHEHEADLEAVRLGASPEALISALKRISELSGVPSNLKLNWITKVVFQNIHPTIPEREAVLRQGHLPKGDTRRPWVYATIAAVVLISSQFTLSTADKIAKKNQLELQDKNRAPASTGPILER